MKTILHWQLIEQKCLHLHINGRRTSGKALKFTQGSFKLTQDVERP